jgi:hypothetical protein
MGCCPFLALLLHPNAATTRKVRHKAKAKISPFSLVKCAKVYSGWYHLSEGSPGETWRNALAEAEVIYNLAGASGAESDRHCAGG